jgi:hypothetical protein
MTYPIACVMNILTHDTAYSFFPRATFEDRISLSLSQGSRNESALTKYANRGWTILEWITSADLSNRKFLFPQKLRYVGDTDCWKMPIFPQFVPNQPSSSLNISMESNSWRVHYNSNLFPVMIYEVVTSPRLQFSYLIDSEDKSLKDWVEDGIGESESDSESERLDSRYDVI